MKTYVISAFTCCGKSIIYLNSNEYIKNVIPYI